VGLVGPTLQRLGLRPPPVAVPPVPARTALVTLTPGRDAPLALFVLAGQSNMSGYADLPDDNEPPDPRVVVFGNDYRWRLAQEPTDDGRDQVDAVSYDRGGYSPAMAFALRLLERDSTLRIGLIPCAKGASAIGEWQRSLSDATLYGSCLKRVRAAAPVGSLRGMLVFQGEADAVGTPEPGHAAPRASTWDSSFVAFIRDFRADVALPRLPVVFAQLGDIGNPEGFPHWAEVQRRQEALRFPQTAMIRAVGLPLFDGIHYTPAGAREIGRRFADAWWGLAAGLNAPDARHLSAP
jgi:hypothetical protein